jgi:dTDP-glucose 4,6-dehydratase
MNYQRFAVLGANSFAGQAFIAHMLAKGAKIVGFNRSAEGSEIFLPYRSLLAGGVYKFFKADINHDLDLIIAELDQFRPQVIVDFAGQGMVAESWQTPEQWYSTNIVSKVRLHNQLRQRDWLERYIRISTPEVYGSQSSLSKESWQYNPSTPYAVSHAAIDMSLRAFQQQYGFPVIFTRHANFFGPGQQLYRIIPRTIIYALTGRKLQLQGGGISQRAFIYGSDVAEGILRATEMGVVGDSYHFSSDRFLTIRQVVEIICERMAVSFESLVELAPDRPGKDQAYLMDSSKARNTLGWKDSVSFEEGIDSTITWVKSSLNEICKLPFNYIHKA